MPKNILFLIQEELVNLPKAEKKLAEWILANSTKVIHMNVTTLAKAASSSPATIVRLCYSLGLEGFTDLKLNISKILPEIEEKLHTDIVKNEEILQIKKKLNYKIASSFNETIHKLDDSMIEKSLDFIEDSEVQYTYGIGSSGLVAEDVFQKLTRIGKNVLFTKDYHLLATSLVTNPKKGVFIAVSNSGEKLEVIHLAKIAREQKIKVIVVTKDGSSTLARLADAVLLTASGGEAVLRSSGTTSMLVQLFTVDILFSAYASRHYDVSIERLSKSKEVIKKVERINK